MIHRIIGAIALLGLSGVIAVANVESFAALGSPAPYLIVAGTPISTQSALGVLAVAIDFLMIAALFAIGLAWRRRRLVQATLALLVWGICASASLHSLWLWINANLAAVQTPAAQSVDVYTADKEALAASSKKVSWLLATDVTRYTKKERARHLAEIEDAQKEVADLRRRVASATVITPPNPITGFEWIAASLLMVLHAVGWFAIFGSGHPNVRAARQRDDGGVTSPVTALVTAAVTPPETPVVTAGVTPPVTPAEIPGVTPEKSSLINAVSGVTPVCDTGPVTAAVSSVTPPRDAGPVTPPRPPGTRAVTPGVTATNIISFEDAVVPAVRRWVRSSTDKEPKGFMPASDAWSSYCQSGGPTMPEGDFHRALRIVLGEKSAGRKRVDGKQVRGYAGVALKPEAGSIAIST